MKLSSKLVAVALVCLAAVAIVASVAKWSWSRVERFGAAQEAGMELLLQSNRVHGRLKDLMFDLFSPQTYGLLKDVVHVPRAMHLLRTFDEDVAQLNRQYDAFFEDASVHELLTDERLQRDYEAARTIGERAFSDIERLRRALSHIEATAPVSRDGLYRQVILADIPETETFLQDVRSVSYYFSETFERLLVHFIGRLNDHSTALQERTVRTFWVVTGTTALVALVLPFLFAAKLTRRLALFDEGVKGIGTGDFHVRLPEGRPDEIGVLLRHFNYVVGELSHNIDSVSGLLQSVGRRISTNPTFESLLTLVADATISYTHVDSAVFYDDSANSGEPLVVRRRDGSAVNPDKAADASFLLSTRVRPFLRLAVYCEERPLSDLDRSHLKTLSEYATLLIDHNDLYRELLDRRQAAYDALQAQIQPHFLFNVLGGMFGLNRSGDTVAVERSLICLRNMLRYIVDHPDVTTLGDEFAFTRSYLELQEIRFGDRLVVEVDCHDDVRDVAIPKLALQPIVENAVIHGVEPKPGPSHIQVRAKADATGRCRIEVVDDGVGFDADDHRVLKTADPGSEGATGNGLGLHIGIQNVRDRLSLLYPGTKLTVTSKRQRGTEVRIDIPTAVRSSVVGR